MEKERIDILLVERNLFSTREKAKAAIMAGIVYVETERIDKPGVKIDISKQITVKGNIHPYVGRGGLKLEKAIEFFQLQLQGKIMIDIGASTGGFTDCALQNNVANVYAVDVGYGQLDWKLRNDERVVVLERTNFRYLEKERLTVGFPNVATIDVSFISLKLILPKLAELMPGKGEVIALIKPQFEAGKELVGKKGIVKDAKVHRKVLETVIDSAQALHFYLKGLTFSPITGGDGNIEFLAYFVYLPEHVDEYQETIFTTTEQKDRLVYDVVAVSHEQLQTAESK